DIVLGWAYTLVAVLAARGLMRRWSAWRAADSAPALSPEPGGAPGGSARAEGSPRTDFALGAPPGAPWAPRPR
ncbi:MAG: phosphatase PAP2 family protein, partial [Solirubrobacteraceae bacterium]